MKRPVSTSLLVPSWGSRRRCLDWTPHRLHVLTWPKQRLCARRTEGPLPMAVLQQVLPHPAHPLPGSLLPSAEQSVTVTANTQCGDRPLEPCRAPWGQDLPAPGDKGRIGGCPPAAPKVPEGLAGGTPASGRQPRSGCSLFPQMSICSLLHLKVRALFTLDTRIFMLSVSLR